MPTGSKRARSAAIRSRIRVAGANDIVSSLRFRVDRHRGWRRVARDVGHRQNDVPRRIVNERVGDVRNGLRHDLAVAEIPRVTESVVGHSPPSMIAPSTMQSAGTGSLPMATTL